MAKLLLDIWFRVTLPRRRINAETFAAKLFAYVNARGGWRKKYAYVEFAYCSDRYMEIYGARQYAELANRLFKKLDAEEEKSRKKINDLMAKFLNGP